MNSVSLYLPHYDTKALKAVIDYLSSPETGLAAAPEFIEGSDLLELPRDKDKAKLFKLAETLPTYSVERVSKASNVRRLIRLGRALSYDKLDTGAFEAFRKLVVSTLDDERKRLAKTADFKKAIKEGARIDVRGVNVAYGVETEEDEELDESFEAVAAVSRNIDDLHAQSGRKLGEGLHIAYVKARVANDSIKPGQAKLELAALLDDAKTTKALEDKAGKVFQVETDKHKAAIRDLPEARRDTYRKLRRQATKPQTEELELPELYQASKGEQTYKKHLYADDKGNLSCTLNEWEKSTVEAELARGDEVLGWLRTIPRKSWAFTVPYDHDGDRPMYPDFLFFRKQGDGIVVDVLEPHALSHDDSSSKAKGLADFAAEHGDDFGRIELIVKEKGKLLRLDVNQDGVRDKVRAVSDNQHLKQLFEGTT